MQLSIDWKKTTFEAFVIVSSILLAFSIDALWQDSRERRNELEILSAIKEDMSANSSQITYILNAEEQAVENSRRFISMTAEQIRDAELETPEFDLDTMFMRSLYTPAVGSLSNFNLSQINDTDLRNAISLWLRRSERIIFTSPILEEELNSLRSIAEPYGVSTLIAIRFGFLEEDTPLGVPVPQTVYSALRSNEEFVTELVSVNIRRSQEVTGTLRLLKEQTLLLVELLEEAGV